MKAETEKPKNRVGKKLIIFIFMKTLELNQMESLQGGELSDQEACIVATGTASIFIASGFLSWAGVAIMFIAVGGVCNQ